MLKIFAKHGSSEKVLVCCEQNEINRVLHHLGDKYGGNWLWVDKINMQSGEILKFDDGLKYLGFHGKDERYCSGIEKLI